MERPAPGGPGRSAPAGADDAGRIGLGRDYHAYTRRSTRSCGPRNSAIRRNGRLRALLDQQLVSLQHATGAVANRLQRKLMRSRPHLEFDLEEGCSTAPGWRR